jgi:MerR family mercuric resistance operon transcriptional regulator
MAAGLTIGQLASAAGVNVETIRYYQRRGLLAEPAKPSSGHRRYPADMLQRLRFIKRAQMLGFTLGEITGLLRLDAGCECAEARELATRKLRLIEAKIAGLAAIRQVLAGLVRQCDAGDGGATCPIIGALAQADDRQG